MAVMQNAPSASLIESAARWLAASTARRRAKRGSRPGILGAVGEVFGTLLAMGCLSVAAFAVGFALGMAAAGVALLLLDFKVTVVRRTRAAQGRR
jgi:hypothetical protein